MRPTLSPIQTLSYQAISARFDRLEIYSLIGKPLPPCFISDLVALTFSTEKPSSAFKSGSDRYGQLAGQMFVAASRKPKLFGLLPLVEALAYRRNRGCPLDRQIRAWVESAGIWKDC